MKHKRKIAALLAASLLCGTCFSHIIANAKYGQEEADKIKQMYKREIDWTFSDDANGQLRNNGYWPTGLAFEITETFNQGSDLGYEKYWANARDPKIVEYPFEDGSTATIDFSKLDNHYLSCISEHVASDPATLNFPGVQLALKQAYLPTKNTEDYPDFIDLACGGDLEAMKFNLVFTQLVHGRKGSFPDSDMKDSISNTGYSIIMYCMVRAIEGGYPMTKDSADANWEKLNRWIDGEIKPKYNPSKEGNSAIYNQVLGECRTYFNECWEQAVFLSEFQYTGNSVMLGLSEAAVGEDGQYHRTYTYTHLNPAAIKYMQALKVKTNGPGITVTNDGSKIDLAAATAEELSSDSESLKALTMELNSSVGTDLKIAPSILVGLKFIGIKTGGDYVADPTSQERFAAVPIELTVNFGPPSGTPTNPGEPNPPTSSEEVIRYKHTETWNAHYNINLHKFDSETGKGLEGARFDVLEAFDDSQLDSTQLESDENWQNESGSQFLKWEGWDYGPVANPDGDSANDPCEVDSDTTNEEGYLMNDATGDLAHTDVKSYTYQKGWCGGHPAKPEPEEDPETGEILNQDEIDAWEEEVEKCEKLVSEKGYFCATAENGYENGEDESGEESRAECLQKLNLNLQMSAVKILRLQKV